MKRNRNTKYLLTVILMMIFILTGCGKNENQSVEESSSVSNSNTDVYVENNTNTSTELLDSIYEKLSDADKEIIVNLSEANIGKVILESDKGVKKVNDSVDVIGNEIYKAEYKTNNETLGNLIVYADVNDLSILGYGLID